MSQLNGRTAIVTGASRGIGKELAIALAELGVDIAIVYAGNDNKAQETQKEIEQLGRQCIIIKADLRNENCANIIKSKIEEADILIHNASMQYRNRWEEISIDEFNEQVNCNFRAALMITQKYITHMKEQKWGRIITIGSVQEVKPHPDMLVYSAVKNALASMAKSLALQLAPYGITVNSIAPGVILTDRNTEVLNNKDYYEATLSKIPLGRCGNTSDCSGIVKLICSDEGEYITGQNIFVDGGMGIK